MATSTDKGLIDLLLRLRSNVLSSDRGAHRRLAPDQVRQFFDDWPEIEQKLRVILSGNALTLEQEELKSAMVNDD